LHPLTAACVLGQTSQAPCCLPPCAAPTPLPLAESQLDLFLDAAFPPIPIPVVAHLSPEGLLRHVVRVPVHRSHSCSGLARIYDRDLEDQAGYVIGAAREGQARRMPSRRPEKDKQEEVPAATDSQKLASRRHPS